MNLAETYAQFRAALEPLGVEVGAEVLALWLDRQKAGRDPMPESALHHLAAWAAKHLAEQLGEPA